MASPWLSTPDLLSQLFESSPAIQDLALSLAGDGKSAKEIIQNVRSELLGLVDQASRGTNGGPGSRGAAHFPSGASRSPAAVAAEKTILEVINAHPRLGTRPNSSGHNRTEKQLSELSRQEQDRMKAASAAQGATAEQTEAENRELVALQDEYEAKYGMRYLVFVNGRPRSEILADLKRRIGSDDVDSERRTAIEATCDIALQRADRLVGRG